MDELHAAIVAYLRRHRLLRAVLREHEVAIRAFRHDRAAPCCRYCGRPLDRDDQCHDLGLRSPGWACTACYLGTCGR